MSKRELTRYFKTRHTNDHHGYRKKCQRNANQIIMACHCTLARIFRNKMTKYVNMGVEKEECSSTTANIKVAQSLWKVIWKFLRKIRRE